MHIVRFVVLAVAFNLACAGPAWADDEVVIGPAYRFEAALDEDWWALEFVGAARRLYDNVASVWRTEVVAAWMRDRSDDTSRTVKRTVRLAFSGDAGTSWAFEDFQAPQFNAHEFDPMACFDPVTGSLYVGSMTGGTRDYLSRLAANAHDLSELGELQLIFQGGNLQAHRPSAGAGPKPGALTESRIYANLFIPDLIWSDELGAQGSWKGPITVGDGVQGWCVPRVGNGGQLVLAHRYSVGGTTEIRLDRSVALDTDSDETPLFLQESTVATTNGIPVGEWLPSNLRLTDVVGCAVAPHDGKRVYVVWMDRTSQSSNDCETTNHNIDLYFSMTADATVTTPTWTTKKIVPAGTEVPGDQFYPWLEATTFESDQGPATRLHLVWYDSRHDPDQCDTNAPDGSFWFDAYYAYSDDEGSYVERVPADRGLDEHRPRAGVWHSRLFRRLYRHGGGRQAGLSALLSRHQH